MNRRSGRVAARDRCRVAEGLELDLRVKPGRTETAIRAGKAAEMCVIALGATGTVMRGSGR